MSHTPGPWVTVPFNDCQFAVKVTGDEFHFVCITSQGNDEANARLIATAPDLLRLLKESVSTLADTRRPIEDWLNEARAVIRKATGVQQ